MATNYNKYLLGESPLKNLEQMPLQQKIYTKLPFSKLKKEKENSSGDRILFFYLKRHSINYLLRRNVEKIVFLEIWKINLTYFEKEFFFLMIDKYFKNFMLRICKNFEITRAIYYKQ